MPDSLSVDVLIFGGGVAGLWTLAQLKQRGLSAVLLETGRLGTGQTIAAQGIIHGGLKYSLQGLVTPAALAIREMPALWRQCLRGQRQPDLQATVLRSNSCFLWQTRSLSSRLGMLGARLGLQVTPEILELEDRPPFLRRCPGHVARLDEPVICPASLIGNFAAAHQGQLLHINEVSTVRRQTDGGWTVNVRDSAGEMLALHTASVVLTAGAGNLRLRQRFGLHTEIMQRRPLHMVTVRGPLPWLCGHCVEGAGTRVTITSSRTEGGQTVWQIGGQLAEMGVDLSAKDLVRVAQSELATVLPGVDFSHLEWATYRVDRAEASNRHGARPDSIFVEQADRIWTAWPTKMVLAPLLAEEISRQLEQSITQRVAENVEFSAERPRPTVARFPWEDASVKWLSDADTKVRAA